jgi:hypothetical protein
VLAEIRTLVRILAEHPFYVKPPLMAADKAEFLG